MRNQLKTVYSALALVAMMGLTSTAYGVPAFARQTGLDCNSCHASSGFPTLNSFGAAFKAGGFTQGNDDDMIGDGEALSIPKALPFSLVYKVRNPIGQKSATPDGGDKAVSDVTNEFENPDEFALLFGGRAGKNIGYLVEWGGDGPASFKLVFAPELGPIRIGIVPFFSDLGPAYTFETLSTGAARNIRPIEERKSMSAMNAISYGGLDGAPIGGVGIYVWHPFGYINYTPFIDTGAGSWYTSEVGQYLRAAVTPSFGGVELAVGAQYIFSANGYDADGVPVVKDADGATRLGKYSDGVRTGDIGPLLNVLAIDAQAYMNIGIPLAVMASYAINNSNSWMTTVPVPTSSLNFYVEAAIVPDVFIAGVAAGFLTEALNGSDTDTKSSSAFTLALKYHITRNIKAEVDTTYKMGSNSVDGSVTDEWKVMPMLFAAF